jgi:hypothetical protein
MVRTLADANLDDNDRQLLGDVEEHGWHVVLIADEDSVPGWAFSVGLFQTFRHPEITVFGLPVELAHHVINGIGEDIKNGKPFKAGAQYPDILEGVECAIRHVEPIWYRPFLGYATWYYHGLDFPCLQCVWPDKQQRFPWEKGFKKEWLAKQPLLFEKDPVAARTEDFLRSTGDWKFPEPTNVITITTRQVVKEGKPILLATHDGDESAWQFLSGDPVDLSDAMVVCLWEMVKLDPTLAELADLPVGWRATREAVGKPWRRTRNPGKRRHAKSP